MLFLYNSASSVAILSDFFLPWLCVRAYRCIHDSGEITVGDLAAFVGRNESGKTTILYQTLQLYFDTVEGEFERILSAISL